MATAPTIEEAFDAYREALHHELQVEAVLQQLEKEMQELQGKLQQAQQQRAGLANKDLKRAKASTLALQNAIVPISNSAKSIKLAATPIAE